MTCYYSCLLLFLSFLSAAAAAFNITTILAQYSDFSSFNSLLSQTKLADEINNRRTITVFAVDNGAVGSISGRPDDVVRDVLALHVVLDYYDHRKLSKLPNKTTVLTTLFQTTGVANHLMGFLNATDDSNGDVRLGSAVPGSPLDVRVVKVVTTNPYNISVVQVSGLVVPQGIENLNSTANAPPVPAVAAPEKAPAPKKAPLPKKAKAKVPTKAGPPAESPSEEADGPTAGGPGTDVEGPGLDESVAWRVGFGGSVTVAMGIVALFASI